MRRGRQHVSLGKVREHEDVIYRGRAGEYPEVLRNEISVESRGDLFCGSDDCCGSLWVDAYFGCDIERSITIEKATCRGRLTLGSRLEVWALSNPRATVIRAAMANTEVALLTSLRLPSALKTSE